MIEKLMIGNYVTTILSDKPQKIKSLKQNVLPDGIINFVGFGKNGDSLPPEHIYGIPLTDDILKEFGFDEGESDDNEGRKCWSIQVANNTSLYFDPHKDWMRGNEDIEWYLSHEWNNNHFKNDFWACPKYVHELQNLYTALTGSQLKLTNA